MELFVVENVPVVDVSCVEEVKGRLGEEGVVCFLPSVFGQGDCGFAKRRRKYVFHACKMHV